MNTIQTKTKESLNFIMSIQFQVEYRFRAQLHRTKNVKYCIASISLSVYNQNQFHFAKL